MAKATVYIYIATVVIFTLLPVHGKNVICKNANYKSVGGRCFITTTDVHDWTESSESCKSLNGKLATFSSVDQMKEVFTGLGLLPDKFFWVGPPRVTVGPPSVAEETGGEWYAVWHKFNIGLHVDLNKCEKPYPILLKSVCQEKNNDKDNINDSTIKTIQRPQANQKATCLYTDSVLVDGLCFRMSTNYFLWPDASNYCKSWNGTIATISSVQQGIKVFTALNIKEKILWATDPLNNDKAKYIYIFQRDPCIKYQFGQTFLNDEQNRVLCIE